MKDLGKLLLVGALAYVAWLVWKGRGTTVNSVGDVSTHINDDIEELTAMMKGVKTNTDRLNALAEGLPGLLTTLGPSKCVPRFVMGWDAVTGANSWHWEPCDG
jgi:hypothetical protein